MPETPAASTPGPRTPVVIGVGQLSHRVDRGEAPMEPAALMAEAARRAVTDAATDSDAAVLAAVDSVRTVGLLSWRYRNPGLVVAQQLGLREGIDTAVSPMGGNSPQSLLNKTALDILAGKASCVVLSGAEAWRTRMAMRAHDQKPDWTVQDESVPEARTLGTDVDMNHPAEVAQGIFMPVQVYPLFEQARRHRLGRGLEEHRSEIAKLWSRFSEVAAQNPNAWIQEAMTPEQVATPSARNRMIGYPYTKVMNANNAVEQSAAILLCSVEVAERLGVPREKWVFPLGGADSHEHPYVSNRADLHSSPAVGVAGRALFEATGTGPEQVDHLDLYSCFPVAVQVAAEELGFDLERQLTVTGGLSFAGGPWNNYVMHSIATMVEVLRRDPGTLGFVWANGGYFTKHAFGLYSTEPRHEFVHVEPQDVIDALPKREVAPDHAGPVTIESYTVMHDKENQPENAIFALLTPDGQRTWGTSNDPVVMKAILADDVIGQPADRSPEGVVTL